MHDKKWYDKWRRKYKPSRIRCLLVAESPPKSKDGRFFYNPHQEKYDFLFKSVMEVIFPDFKTEYRKGKKDVYLRRFQKKGFYLIDASDEPINARSRCERCRIIIENLKEKVNEIKKLVSKNTPIILIKKNVFAIFYPVLKGEGFNVINGKAIPFPSSGQQKKFKESFRKYLEKADLL